MFSYNYPKGLDFMKIFRCFKLKTIALAATACALVLAALITTVVFVYADNKIDVPIIMYHSILKDEERLNDYVLSPVDFEKDLVYLRENGYETVFVSELIDYVKGIGELPEKPVVITLDDGFYNNLTYVLPILERLDMKATISVVGDFCDRDSQSGEKSPYYSCLAWDDLRQMQQSGHIEIANHTYSLHSDTGERKGCCIKSGESFSDYQNILIADVMKLQRRLFEETGSKPSVFTYPYGFICDESIDILKGCGFEATLTCREKVNIIEQGNPDCLLGLCRFNRPSGISTEKFMKKILR